MLLFLLIIVFLSIEYSMLTRIDHSDLETFFDGINRERVAHGRQAFQRDPILQFAAEKRCHNRDALFHTYRQMQMNEYQPEQWPKEEHLDRYFPYGNQYGDDLFFDSFVSFSRRSDFLHSIRSARSSPILSVDVHLDRFHHRST